MGASPVAPRLALQRAWARFRPKWAHGAVSVSEGAQASFTAALHALDAVERGEEVPPLPLLDAACAVALVQAYTARDAPVFAAITTPSVRASGWEWAVALSLLNVTLVSGPLYNTPAALHAPSARFYSLTLQPYHESDFATCFAVFFSEMVGAKEQAALACALTHRLQAPLSVRDALTLLHLQPSHAGLQAAVIAGWAAAGQPRTPEGAPAWRPGNFGVRYAVRAALEQALHQQTS